ncbi:MAG: adenylate cyclase regulatory domain-containing protein [Acidimicrobiia bacterium]
MDLEEFQVRGLYDPGVPGAAVRRELLELLVARGATVDELVAADADGRLPLVATDLELRQEPARYTLAEFADRMRMPVALVERVWSAAGLPELDARTTFFRERDVATFEAFRAGASLLGVDVTVQFTRVLGSSMARIADAAVAAFVVNVEAKLAERGATELDLARASIAGIQSLRGLPAAMEVLFEAHVADALLREQLSRSPASQLETAHLAIGFVDLVGYTAMSQQLSNAELSSAVTDFEEIAADAVTARQGRVVKLIGDEVMFVVHDAVGACEAALAIVDAVEAHVVLDTARAGLAFGDLVRGGGDYYGPLVNAAARAAKVAHRGTVLGTVEVRDAVAQHGDGLHTSGIGARRLRGFDQPVRLYKISRTDIARTGR